MIFRVVIAIATLPIMALMLWQFAAGVMMSGWIAYPIMMVALLATIPVLILLHELGHVGAGLAVGLPFRSLMMPFLTVTLTDGRLRFQRSAAFRRPLGSARHSWTPGRAQRWAVFAAGGPAVSCAVGVGLLWIAAIANSSRHQDYVGMELRPIWKATCMSPGNLSIAWLNLAGLASLFLGIGALAPARVGKHQTDGAHILNALQGKHPIQIFMPNVDGAIRSRSLTVPTLMAAAPDVSWSPEAQQVVNRLKSDAQAIWDRYLGTSHLLLAAAFVDADRLRPVGLTYAAIRQAVIAIKATAEDVEPSDALYWPAPRLRHAISLAAMRAIAAGRPIAVQDIWHALLTDPESESVAILESLNVNPAELVTTLASMPSADALTPPVSAT